MSRRRYVLPVLLVIGWAGLFAYSAAYLTEDLPFRPQKPEAASPAETASGQAPSPRPVVVLDRPRGSGPGPAADAVPAVQAIRAPAPPSRPVPAPVGAEYVGLWGPHPNACAARSRRRGYIPAMIAQDQARAGRTLCTFHDTRRAGNAWVTAAECNDRGRRWASQVRLTVEGDHLTWSSSRGTVTYTRCGRRAG
ncbi:peptidase inhibitor family I36 protein [Methylobacterium sp. J-026]|uniref:peptidase inhibitor family I36 protein n=1 Tax=Methylobacterium sp. J-026 TaxID=2836624 RepID=UPI001FB9854F|nr:peptidase inhibitor family I36 protein [Methylobacterium sp. J-026]MCJ2135457.1 peptidase inhibitor family I36 protein [Methylobacterium sp. J-026]